MEQKCYRQGCGKIVIVPWYRGPFVYCSPECRDEAKKDGFDERWSSLGQGDEQIYTGKKGPGEP